MTHYPKDPVINEVITQIMARADEGMKKFGQPIEEAPGDPVHWLNQAIEEAMDTVVYLVKMKRTLTKVKRITRIAPDDVYIALPPNNNIMSCPCASCLRK